MGEEAAGKNTWVLQLEKRMGEVSKRMDMLDKRLRETYKVARITEQHTRKLRRAFASEYVRRRQRADEVKAIKKDIGEVKRIARQMGVSYTKARRELEEKGTLPIALKRFREKVREREKKTR